MRLHGGADFSGEATQDRLSERAGCLPEEQVNPDRRHLENRQPVRRHQLGGAGPTPGERIPRVRHVLVQPIFLVGAVAG